MHCIQLILLLLSKQFPKSPRQLTSWASTSQWSTNLQPPPPGTTHYHPLPPTTTHFHPFVAPPKNQCSTACHTWDGTFTNLHSICGALQGEFYRWRSAVNRWTWPSPNTTENHPPNYLTTRFGIGMPHDLWPLLFSSRFHWPELENVFSGTFPPQPLHLFRKMDFVLEYYLFIRPVLHLCWMSRHLSLNWIYIYGSDNCARPFVVVGICAFPICAECLNKWKMHFLYAD